MTTSKRAQNGQTQQTRFAFRLNSQYPREKVILDYLDSLKVPYLARRAHIKDLDNAA